MMHGFFRAGPVVALALSTTTGFLACMPGQLDTSLWIQDAGPTMPAPPPPPPMAMVDARPPDTDPPAPPPPPPPMRDGGADVTAAQPDGPPAAESWCKDPVEVTARILQPKCGSCHGSATKAGGLDLVTQGVRSRLIDVPSTLCRDQALVTMTPQVGGFLFVKLDSAVAGCGDRMPVGLPWLNATEVQCLKDWLNAPPR
jgi:hypothetical protein